MFFIYKHQAKQAVRQLFLWPEQMHIQLHMHIHTPFFPSHRHRLLLGCYLRHMHTTTPALHCIPYTEHSHADVWWVGSDTNTYIYAHTPSPYVMTYNHVWYSPNYIAQTLQQQQSRRESNRPLTGAALGAASGSITIQGQQQYWQAGRRSVR